MEQEKLTGTVKFYKSEAGFGFITVGEKDYFFHFSNLAEGYENPQQDDEVEFELTEGRKGPEAINVQLVA